MAIQKTVVCSLVDDGTASVVGEFTMTMQRHWTCPRCQAGMVVNISERLEHEAFCQAQNITGGWRGQFLHYILFHFQPIYMYLHYLTISVI